MDGLGSGKSLAGGFIYFIFSPLFGEDEPNLTNIFEIGWNHQLDHSKNESWLCLIQV